MPYDASSENWNEMNDCCTYTQAVHGIVTISNSTTYIHEDNTIVYRKNISQNIIRFFPSQYRINILNKYIVKEFKKKNVRRIVSRY